jgi:hypothetical protein
MIDFSKIGTGSTVDTVIPPREIFNALPDKDAKKFQYPRDVQSQVWAKWFDRRNESSLVIKMNTGSGKTVVGLLLLKSCLNEGRAPAVYVCPDKYLVKQVIDAAKELGLETTDNPDSPRFLSGKAILVTNIYKLINAKSVFGVGQEGIKIKISSLIIDDAHACLQTVEEQFTIDIPPGSSTHNAIFATVRDSLREQCESKTIEIETGDPFAYLSVPYWVWHDKASELTGILSANANEEFLKFTWPLLKEQPKLTHCVIGADGIEISPYAVPMHMIPSIMHADRKVFMTATLVDDSIIASHFGVSEEQIKHPIVPDSAGDVGDRMILLPQVINTETTDADVKAYCKSVSQHHNVVVIVPSHYRAKFWQDAANLVLTASNMYGGIEQLKAGHVGLVVLINKYDGIDLPGDACRMLVVDGFPDVRRKIDMVEQSVLLGSERNANQIIQRIEQGMGRAIRSNDDYCVVLLTGRDLTRQLYSQGAIDKFSPATKAQLKLSEQVSDQIKGKAIGDLMDTINLCLGRNTNWKTASKGVLASLKYTEDNELGDVTIAQRKAYDYAWDGNPVRAAGMIQEVVWGAKDKTERGYLKRVLARMALR